MPGRLANKTAVITGSSSGIGRAIALAFAAEGASIVCSDIREDFRTEHRTDDLDGTTLQEVEKLGAKAIYQKCDTTQSSEIQALIKKAVETFGRLDVFVNNAGIAVEAGSHGPKPVWEFDEATFDKTIEVNLKGVFMGTKYATLQMKDQEPLANGDRGWVVNIASVYGLGGAPGFASYISSKHAVVGLTKCSAWDCAPYRIHVNAICPGYTETSLIHGILTPEMKEHKEKLAAMHPFRGLGTPKDIARAAVFLSSEDASWISGIAMPVDGAYTSM